MESHEDIFYDAREEISSHGIRNRSVGPLSVSEEDEASADEDSTLLADQEAVVELSQKEMVARIIAQRLEALDNGNDDDSVHSYPRDPFERLEQSMREEEEQQKYSTKKSQRFEKRIEQSEERDTSKRDCTSRKREKSNVGGLDDEQRAIIRRIVELRIAAIEAEGLNEDVGIGVGPGNPQDPLMRIMNMNAEDSLFAAVALMQYSVQPEALDPQDDEAILCRRDMFELNGMIQHDELKELEREAIFLAQTVKDKLDRSDIQPIAFPPQNNSSGEGGGYDALARKTASRSLCRESTTLDDDGSDMSSRQDQFHDCSSRPMKADDSPSRSKVSTVHQSRISATNQTNGRIEQLDLSKDVADPVSPKKKITSSPTDTATSNWLGIVGCTNVRAATDLEESDSHSMSSTSTDSVLVASFTSSDVSLGMIARDGEIDWAGIRAVIHRYHNPSSTNTSTAAVLRESNLEEKRRRKRELEALKISMTDSWRSSARNIGV